jgi:isochorismate hydrolase
VGAEFPENVAALISSQSGDVVITKTWYSAFEETTLLTDLRDRGITDIYVGGLITNVCVAATVTKAHGLAFDVKVVEDCLGWRKLQGHEKALQNMRELPVQVVISHNVIKEVGAPPAESVVSRLPRLYYVNGSIPSWRVLMALYEKVRSMYHCSSLPYCFNWLTC